MAIDFETHFPVCSVKEADFGARGDGVSDDTTAIQSAIAYAQSVGGVQSVYLPAGNYLLSSALSITSSNVRLIGAGMGLTTLTMAATSTASAISCYNSTYGASRPLLFDATTGDTWVTVSTADAATFSVGDYVMVRSLKSIDTESPTNKFAGEIHQVATVDAATGVLLLSDMLADTYTTAQSASVLKVTMLSNLELADFTVTHAAAASASYNSAAILMRQCIAARIKRVEVKDAFNTGIDLWACLNTQQRECSVKNIKAGASSTVYYGTWVSGASRNCVLANNYFEKCRHSVAMGTHTNSGTNTLSTDAREGVQRHILVQGNQSYASTTAHFDVHQPGEGIAFLDNLVYGAWPTGAPDTSVWNSSVYGIQSRAKRVLIKGNTIEQTRGGILLFGPNTQDVDVVGNTIRDSKQAGVMTQLSAGITSGAATVPLRDATGFAASGSVTISGSAVTYTSIVSNVLQGCSGAPTASMGAGVYQMTAGTGNGVELDSTCTGTGISIVDNQIVDTDAAGVRGQGNQSRVTVAGNYLRNNSRIGNFGSVQFGGTSNRIDVRANRIEENPNSRPVSISGGDNHRIVDNYFQYNATTAPSWAGANTAVRGNRGYTPGTLANAFPTQSSPTAWQITTAYVLGNIVSNGGSNYICVQAGTSAGAGGPSGTGTGNITDNTVLWKWLYPGAMAGWQPSTAYAQGAMVSNGGRVFECQVAGTSAAPGAAGPTSNGASLQSDGTASWKYLYEGSELYANLAGGSAAPVSGYIHVVRSGPCNVNVTGGTLTVLAINGTTIATAAGNYNFKLGVGDTISCTYSAAPTFKVTYE
jgi:hypothetical protein